LSAVNEVGESNLSTSSSIVFANVPEAPASLVLEAHEDDESIIAKWTAPVNVNGDAVSGYKVYVDDGYGGEFVMIFDGDNYASTYQYTITSLNCGLNYFV
jgi:hypothetical protein